MSQAFLKIMVRFCGKLLKRWKETLEKRERLIMARKEMGISGKLENIAGQLFKGLLFALMKR